MARGQDFYLYGPQLMTEVRKKRKGDKSQYFTEEGLLEALKTIRIDMKARGEVIHDPDWWQGPGKIEEVCEDG